MRGINGTWYARAIGHKQCGCAVDAVLLAEFNDGIDVVVVTSHCGWQNTLQHPVVPSFGAVFGAGNVAGFVFGVFAQYGVQHVINGHVVNFLQVFFKAFAVAAIGIGKDHQLALAIAFDLRKGKLQGNAVKGDG